MEKFTTLSSRIREGSPAVLYFFDYDISLQLIQIRLVNHYLTDNIVNFYEIECMNVSCLHSQQTHPEPVAHNFINTLEAKEEHNSEHIIIHLQNTVLTIKAETISLELLETDDEGIYQDGKPFWLFP